MKFWRVGLISLLLFSSVKMSLAAPQLLDSAVVIVNKEVILESEIQSTMQMVKLHMGQRSPSLPDDVTLYRQVRESLIVESIQLQLAAKLGLQLSEQELEQGIADVARQRNVTPDQLRQALITQGIDYTQYREQLRKEMLTSKVRIQQVRQRINVLPQEVEALAKQLAQEEQQDTEFELRHILLALPENPTAQQIAQTEKLAQQLLLQLQQGADFSRLAISYSVGTQALRGGKLEWVKLEALPTPFAERLQGVKKGALIAPFRTGVGFHILRVDDLRTPRGTDTLEIHARHILLQTSVMFSDQQAAAKLQQLARQIKQGHKTFEELARQYSQDIKSAAQGGDLGWADPAIYDPAFAAALSQLSPNQLSQPVRTTFGWHLIQRLGTQRVKSPTAVRKEQAMQLIFKRKLVDESQSWLQEQRAAAYVKMLDRNE